jgi:hypothetical protein
MSLTTSSDDRSVAWDFRLIFAPVRRLRHLESENARLKKLVAERDLEIEVMKEINAKKW